MNPQSRWARHTGRARLQSSHTRLAALLVVALALPHIVCAQPPQRLTPTPGDFIIKNFRFTSGEVLPELRQHYRTLGTPRRDASGKVTNAVLIMHGTTGSGAVF